MSDRIDSTSCEKSTSTGNAVQSEACAMLGGEGAMSREADDVLVILEDPEFEALFASSDSLQRLNFARLVAFILARAKAGQELRCPAAASPEMVAAMSHRDRLAAEVVSLNALYIQSREARATHRCGICGARWIRLDEGMWSLASAKCGQCCDCAAMGAPIEAVGLTAQVEALTGELNDARTQAKEWEQAAVDYVEVKADRDRLTAEVAGLHGLLREALVKFESYRSKGFKRSPVVLMLRMEAALKCQAAPKAGG